MKRITITALILASLACATTDTIPQAALSDWRAAQARAHVRDSVAAVLPVQAQAIREDANFRLLQAVRFKEGDSLDLERGTIKRKP